jgi:endonuclease/exonuclease/phosphatase family metal-dependent hydrolase
MSDGHVRAMTWNIWWRFGRHWEERQAAILATLERVRPDVVALQEVWGSDDTTQAHELGRALGMHAVTATTASPRRDSWPISGRARTSTAPARSS